jgi:hypothetical protein
MSGCWERNWRAILPPADDDKVVAIGREILGKRLPDAGRGTGDERETRNGVSVSARPGIEEGSV